MMLRKVASSAFLLSASLYILLPTPDELVIYPVLGMSLSYALQMPFVYGVLLSMIIYRGIGVSCFLVLCLSAAKQSTINLKKKSKKIMK